MTKRNDNLDPTDFDAIARSRGVTLLGLSAEWQSTVIDCGGGGWFLADNENGSMSLVRRERVAAGQDRFTVAAHEPVTPAKFDALLARGRVLASEWSEEG